MVRYGDRLEAGGMDYLKAYETALGVFAPVARSSSGEVPLVVDNTVKQRSVVCPGCGKAGIEETIQTHVDELPASPPMVTVYCPTEGCSHAPPSADR